MSLTYPCQLDVLRPVLQTLPEGMREARGLIQDIDACLHAGFSRLTDSHRSQLGQVLQAFLGTPLAERSALAVAGLLRGELLSEHFEVLASLRASLQGACFDALRTPLSGAQTETGSALTCRAPADPLRDSVCAWLTELALTGFSHLTRSMLQPFESTVEALQAAPHLHRLAALVTGVYEEILLQIPLAETALPSLRLADLWTQCFVSSRFAPVDASDPLNDLELIPLGSDVYAHARYALLRVAGLLLSPNQPPRLVKVCVGTFKPDVFYGMEQWLLFKERHSPLLEALAGHKRLLAKSGSLSQDGTVIPTSPWSLGKELSLSDVLPQLATALPLPPVTAALRHPIQLAEPLWLADIRVTDGPQGLHVTQGEYGLPLCMDRTPPDDPSVQKALLGATDLFGWLRYDGGQFQLQPLAGRYGSGKKAKDFLLGESALPYCLKDKRKSLPTLVERASRLLRQK